MVGVIQGSNFLSYRNASDSSIIPNIDFNWDGYREIVQPEKVSFWMMLGCVSLFIIWIIFMLFYVSRIIGPISGFILTKFIRWKGYNAFISIDSLSISILAGKIMFRNFRWTCCDYVIHCNDGWIVFSYWSHSGAEKITDYNATSRIHLSLFGLQLHFFNRLHHYWGLSRHFRLEKLFSPLNERFSKHAVKLSRAREPSLSSYYYKIWSFVGYVKLDIGSCRIIVGNNLLPSMAILSFENLTSKIKLTETHCTTNLAILSTEVDLENFRLSFTKSTDDENAHFVGRHDPPPRTMGDGFAIVQSANLKIFYNESIIGFLDEFVAIESSEPISESVWRFGNNTILSYGPWAHSQLCLIYKFFFPPEYRDSEITQSLAVEGSRQLLTHDVRISFLNDSCIDTWFMRDDELNVIHLRFQHGSSIDWKIPWVTFEDGFKSAIRCTLLNVESSTSLIFPKFFECETLLLSCNLHYPRVFNGHQKWNFDIDLSKTCLWAAFDIVPFFSDLLSDLSIGSYMDLYDFVPYTWNFNVKATDGFKFITVSNNKNWIDTSSSTASENEFLMLAVETVTGKFDLSLTDFCPNDVSVPLVIETRGMTSFWMFMPQQNIPNLLWQSLMKNVPSFVPNNLLDFVNSDSSTSEKWAEVGRTKCFKVSIIYSYLCAKVQSFTKKENDNINRPVDLLPNNLSVEIHLCDTELLLTGTIWKTIMNLVDNYFGRFNRLSDIADREKETCRQADQSSSPLKINDYRPIAIRFIAKVRFLRAHCLQFNDKGNSGKYPTISNEELVIEVISSPHDFESQIVVGSVKIHFDEITTRSDYNLMLNSFTWSYQVFFSEKSIPWESGMVEYATLTEIHMGSISGKVHHTQLFTISELIEMFILLAACPDDEFIVPEKYQTCQHSRESRACPLSPLNITVAVEEFVNCFSDEDLQFRAIRLMFDEIDLAVIEDNCMLTLNVPKMRFATCNCHETSFASHVSVYIPWIFMKLFALLNQTERPETWSCCGEVAIDDVDFHCYSCQKDDKKHLISERRTFLTLHDKEKMRLKFLWNEHERCACDSELKLKFKLNSSRQKKDSCGMILMQNVDLPVSNEYQSELSSNESRSLFFETKCDRTEKSGEIKINMDMNNLEEVPEFRRVSSDISFQSAVSSHFIDLSGRTTDSILSSKVLSDLYSKFLSSYRVQSECDPLSRAGVKKAKCEESSLKKVRSGVNDVVIERYPKDYNIRRKDSTKYALLQRERSAQLCMSGSLASSVKVFATPLGLEIIESFLEYIGHAAISAHPMYIISYLYAKCVFNHHAPNISEQKADAGIGLISINLSMPILQLIHFHCGLNGKTLKEDISGDSVFQLTRSGLFCLILNRSSLHVSKKTKSPSETARIECNYTQCCALFLQFVERKSLDFMLDSAFSLRYRTNWRELKISEYLKRFDLRIVSDVNLPELSIKGDLHPSLATSPSDCSEKEHKLIGSIFIGPIQFVFGLCKPVDQIAGHEWPLLSIFAPFISAWKNALLSLKDSISSRLEKIDAWIDLLLMRVLSLVLDHADEQVFVDTKSCFDVVRVLQPLSGSCGNCKLVQVLMRYLLIHNLAFMWRETNIDECAKHFPRPFRKEILIALLSQCHTIIFASLKRVDSNLARKFISRRNGIVNCAERNYDPSKTFSRQRESKSSASSRQRITEEAHKNLDLYHWILAKHKEYKESISSSKTVQKHFEESDNPSPVQIDLFFWSIYENRKLGSTYQHLTQIPNFALEWSVNCNEIKVIVLEPKKIASSNIDYVSLTRHNVLSIECAPTYGKVLWRVHIDEHASRPVSVSCDVTYKSNLQSIRCTLSMTSILFLRDVSKIVSVAMAIEKRRANDQDPENKISTSFSSTKSADHYSQSLEVEWIVAILNRHNEYKRTCTDFSRRQSSCSLLSISGDYCCKFFSLEIVLTHLFVSLTQKNIEFSHKHNRGYTKENTLILDDTKLLVQRSYLILSEFVVGMDAKHIVNLSIKSSSFTFRRDRNSNLSVCSFLNLIIGDIVGTMPTHIENMRQVVLRNVSQITEQITRLESNESLYMEDYLPQMQYEHVWGIVFFEFSLSCVEISIQLLPSLKFKYRLEKLESSGYTGSNAQLNAKFDRHVATLIIYPPNDEKSASSLSSDTFTLILPRVLATGHYKTSNDFIDKKHQSFHDVSQKDLLAETRNSKTRSNVEESDSHKNIQSQNEKYFDIVFIIGQSDHSFSTDFLNQILFAERCFRSELSTLVSRIFRDLSPYMSSSRDYSWLSHFRTLFKISVKEEATPWIQITASTASSLAVRLTLDKISATLTTSNENKIKSDSDNHRRLHGTATISLNAKLGQLVKSAMFEEIDAELQEFASFITKISFQNEESAQAYSYTIRVSRPILLLKSTAFEKALLLWLNYKNTYDYWREERKKLLKSEKMLYQANNEYDTSPTEDVNVNISIKVMDGAYICIPLYSSDIGTNMSSLLISLQSTNVTVCIQKGLACQGAFRNFRVRFIENFDEQALNEPSLSGNVGPALSNFFYFPEGTYQIISSATAAPPLSQSAKWLLLVKLQMHGMVIDLDYRIGKLIVLLFKTFSSFASDNFDEDYNESRIISSPGDSDDDKKQYDQLDATGELSSFSHEEERVNWIERKLHEQSLLVSDLMQCGATEIMIEKERRILRELEFARFRQFRKSMIDKLKRNAERDRKQLSGVGQETDEARPKYNFNLSRSSEFGSDEIESLALSSKNCSSRISMEKYDSTYVGDSVDMDISVDLDIQSGMCILRATDKSEEQISLKNKYSIRDLRGKMYDTSSITTFAIPSVHMKANYVSIDFNHSQQLSRNLQSILINKYGRSSQWKRPGLYLSAELASMPQESLVTPSLADFVQRLVEALPDASMSTSSLNFVLTGAVGSANFKHDMRRLDEIISFPKPWYRHAVVRRFFFGDTSLHSVHRPPSLAKVVPQTEFCAQKLSVAHMTKEWSAVVILAMEWKELNICAQMGNTMGTTELCLRNGVLRGNCQLNSKLDKYLMLNFGLESANLSASGGAISGQLSIEDLEIRSESSMHIDKPPKNHAVIKLAEFEGRIEWMSRSIFIAKCVKACVSAQDEWISIKNKNCEITKAFVSVAVSISWSVLQIIVTESTIDDFSGIYRKLHSFFQEQMRNSRRVWGIKDVGNALIDVTGTSNEFLNKENLKQRFWHWPPVLDILTEIQAKQTIFPFPKFGSGVTSVGGIIEVDGECTTFVCMNGEMIASSWALLHLMQTSLLFEPDAQYAFVSENDSDIGVSVSQRLTIKLGHQMHSPHSSEHSYQAVICRVQQGRLSMVRQMSSISAYLEHIIGDPLKQLNLLPKGSHASFVQHSVLPLFQFPALDAVLSTLQLQKVDIDCTKDLISEVLNSFICEFHDSVNVQTDFNAQVSFLPELIKAYLGKKDQTEEDSETGIRDCRHHICEKWIVDPKIRFIDRIKWNPPVIDEILRKLQIFDHRRTIPKAMQRNLLDRCDAVLAQLSLAIVSMAKKYAERSKNETRN